MCDAVWCLEWAHVQVSVLVADLYPFICVGIAQRRHNEVVWFLLFSYFHVNVCVRDNVCIEIHVCLSSYMCEHSCVWMAKSDIQNHLGHFSSYSLVQQPLVYLSTLKRCFSYQSDSFDYPMSLPSRAGSTSRFSCLAESFWESNLGNLFLCRMYFNHLPISHTQCFYFLFFWLYVNSE